MMTVGQFNALLAKRHCAAASHICTTDVLKREIVDIRIDSHGVVNIVSGALLSTVEPVVAGDKKSK